MKQVCGIWLPDGDTHFEEHLRAGPLVDGKATYQWKKYSAALKHCSSRRHGVDVGAHVGLWARVMVKDFGRVTAFEPLAAHRECFEANVEGIELLPLAIGDKCGSIRIHMPAGNTGNAHASCLGETVPMVTLDDVDLDPVDFLKVDVEGFELSVVRGAEQTIRRYRPVIVIEQKPKNAERYGCKQWDAVNLLKSWGMKEAQVISGDHIMVW